MQNYDSNYKDATQFRRVNFRFSDHQDIEKDAGKGYDPYIQSLKAEYHRQLVNYCRYGEDIPYATRLKNLFI